MREALDRQAAFGRDLTDGFRRVDHERLVEEADFLEVGLDAAFDDLFDDVFRFAGLLLARLFDGDFAFFRQNGRIQVVGGDGFRVHRANVHRDLFGQRGVVAFNRDDDAVDVAPWKNPIPEHQPEGFRGEENRSAEL